MTILAMAGCVLAVEIAPFPCGSVSAAEADGGALYKTHCGACHPQGGNIINPNMPVTGSVKMKSMAAFAAFNRNPVKADGSKGTMPAFSAERISNAEMKLIYEYSLTLKGSGK